MFLWLSNRPRAPSPGHTVPGPASLVSGLLAFTQQINRDLVADAGPGGKGGKKLLLSQPCYHRVLMRRRHEILSLWALEASCRCSLGFRLFFGWRKVAVFVLLPVALHKLRGRAPGSGPMTGADDRGRKEKEHSQRAASGRPETPPSLLRGPVLGHERSSPAGFQVSHVCRDPRASSPAWQRSLWSGGGAVGVAGAGARPNVLLASGVSMVGKRRLSFKPSDAAAGLLSEAEASWYRQGS